ncbi:truncated ABC-type transport system permease protein [Spiroplasma mirum ATCC 29335]|nr:truncated ABC-type transport system permease protein [Spiroplasma mirum ATCC 29335]
MLSFLAANGIICALSIFSSQIVILIVTIFYSLFLLVGLPYSLISTLSNNIYFYHYINLNRIIIFLLQY